MAFQPFERNAEVRIHQGKLPHWRQWGATYFVTARLADSLPGSVIDEWQKRRTEWLVHHGIQSERDLPRLNGDLRVEYDQAFGTGIHGLLDAGHGACLFRITTNSACLTNRLIAGHGKAYELDAWCIMPNHLHALVTPNQGTTLGEILRHWKAGSSRDINKLRGQAGGIWQKETFDHIVRTEAYLQHFRKYIANNPANACLKGGYVLGRGNAAGLAPEDLTRS